MELNFNPADDIGKIYFSDPSVFDLERYRWSPEKKINFIAIMRFVKELCDDGVATFKKIYALPNWGQISIKITFKDEVGFTRKRYLNGFIQALQFSDEINIHPDDIEDGVTDMSFYIDNILLPKDE